MADAKLFQGEGTFSDEVAARVAEARDEARQARDGSGVAQHGAASLRAALLEAERDEAALLWAAARGVDPPTKGSAEYTAFVKEYYGLDPDPAPAVAPEPAPAEMSEPAAWETGEQERGR